MTTNTLLDPLLVSVKEARRLLGVGNTKAYQLIREKKLKVVKFGKATRITMESIRAAAGESA